MRLFDDRELDREPAALEARTCVLGIDVLDEPDLSLERAALDLHLLVDAALHLRALPLAADQEDAFAGDDLHRAGLDAGQFDHDRQRMRIVGVKAVDVRTEPMPDPREARD